MPEKKQGPKEEDLLAVLLERNVLSPAQVEVAKIDISATGLSPIDVLLARKWITEQALSDLGTSASSSQTPSSEQIYLDNLRKYRQLMAQIMGEAE